jgi:SAM-dependent methyltransferase
MLSELVSRGLPGVCGTAESIPVRAGWAGAVIVGQAFHWFDQQKAVPEIASRLAPGGTLGLLWNLRDEEVDWVNQLSGIIGSEDAMSSTLGPTSEFEETIRGRLAVGGCFRDIEYHEFPFAQELNQEGLLSLVASRSYVAILPDAARDGLLNDVRTLCEEHPALRARSTFEMPYRTSVFRATRT